MAAKYLESEGLTIVARNYWKKWGEIDIVARETAKSEINAMFSRETLEVVHFVEVKSVSYETKELLERAVLRET